MRKHLVYPAALAVTLLTSLTVSALYAQAGGAKATIGPVKLTWGQSGSYDGKQVILRGGVHMTSVNYDMEAQTVTAVVGRVNGASGIVKATADGDPAKNAQVTGRFEAAAQGRTYYVNGDHAVYTSVAGRKNGGQIDFTGHVVVTIKSPQTLDGPAIIQTGQATVQLGAGADYPQVTFGAGTATFTPSQKP